MEIQRLTQETALRLLEAGAQPVPGASSPDEFVDTMALAGAIDKLIEIGKITPELEPLAAKSDELLAAAGEKDDSDKWNDYYLGRWWAAGDLEDLCELARRAKHRDGSTMALVAGVGAHGLLTQASETLPGAVSALVKLAGFDPAGPLGNHPRQPGGTAENGGAAASPKLPVVDVVAPPPPPPISQTLDDYMAKIPWPVIPRVAPLSGVADFVQPDDTDGSVIVMGTGMTISGALGLGLAITAAVRKLQIPAEGLVWFDDTLNPKSRSSLVSLDPVLAVGLTEPAFGGLLQAEIVQRESDGKYSARVFTFAGGTETLSGGDADLETVKFQVARRVLGLLLTAKRIDRG
jgi:hypothetical protein